RWSVPWPCHCGPCRRTASLAADQIRWVVRSVPVFAHMPRYVFHVLVNENDPSLTEHRCAISNVQKSCRPWTDPHGRAEAVRLRPLDRVRHYQSIAAVEALAWLIRGRHMRKYGGETVSTCSVVIRRRGTTS